MFIHKREAQLDYLEQIHIAAQQLVLIVSVASEFSDRSGHYTWKLRILRGRQVLQRDKKAWPGHEAKVSQALSHVSACSTHHSDVVVLSDDMSDPLQLLLQVVGPNLTYSLAVIHSGCGHSATATSKGKHEKEERTTQLLYTPNNKTVAGVALST